MMKEEFEQLAGYEVSYEDYSRYIEPMYLAANIDKREFVKMIDKKRFALTPIPAMIKKMKKIANELKETCTHYTDYDKQEELSRIVEEYLRRKGFVSEWGKIAAFHIETEQRWSCYYPKEVVIYSTRDYKTIETIKLA